VSENKKGKRQASVSRYPGQRILIGDSIVIRISKVEGKRVFVYIEAPHNMVVLRPSKETDQSDRELGRTKADFKDSEDEDGSN
jgi:sRNA-binding carbon storage regulator CsrA